MEIKSDKQSGLNSIFILSCVLCKKEFKVPNSTKKLNKMAVAGAMSAGCGKVQLNQFTAALDLPPISERRYKLAQDEVCDEWEVTAWEEMRKAGEREKEAAIKEGCVNKDGIPIIDVILDGCWCKRSYKTNYSALSGAAAIIGRRFGQVLFMAVKNKYCCICARAEKRNEVVKEHECFKNFSGASTAMESTIIVEGFRQSIQMHGLIYGRYIADGDSSTYAKILDARPYPFLTVEKIGCKNHIFRNFCNKLQSLKTDTKYTIAERKLLTTAKILKARKYVCDAIKYHGAQKSSKSENIRKLHQDIMVSVSHAFGSHVNCNKNICTDQTSPQFRNIFNTLLWQRIRLTVGNVASQARSLIENVDSNVVERFNGVIAKFVGGKRINYAQKRSYQSRCAGAVISFNSGKILTTVHNTIHNGSPLSKIKKYEEKVNKRREYNRTLKRKKNRILMPKKIDFDYGENANKPDMDPETYELVKSTFLKNLEKTKEERCEIEHRTILQSGSGEWLELRRNLLTASNFGKVVKRIKTNSCSSAVKSMLYRANLDHVASISHGKNNEKVALDQLSKLIKLEIKKCGLFIDEKYPFLGATPDGITDEMVVEIKCPIAPFKIGLDSAIQEGKMHFWRKDKKTGQIYVNKKSDWFMQAQGQMHICKKDRCLLAVWYGENKIRTELITKDDKFWDEYMEPKLLSFYFDCLLPELVDPRYTRNLPIRDPDYVLAKKFSKEINKENMCRGHVAKGNKGESKDVEKNEEELNLNINADDNPDVIIDFNKY